MLEEILKSAAQASTSNTQCCILCPAVFDNLFLMLVHIQLKHPKDFINCCMELLCDESPVEPEPRKSRRPGHPVWSYFQRIDRFDAVCLLCNSKVKSACSTNLSRHILRHHPETAEAISNFWSPGTKTEPTVTQQIRESQGVDSIEEVLKSRSATVHSDQTDTKTDRLESMEDEEREKKEILTQGGGVKQETSPQICMMNTAVTVVDSGPACPVPIHPYETSPSGVPGMSQPGLVGVGHPSGSQMGHPLGPRAAMAHELAIGLTPAISLSNIDLANTWCHFQPSYSDLRPLDQYEEISSLPYHDTQTAKTFIQTAKFDQFDDTKLYHKDKDTGVSGPTKEDDDDMIRKVPTPSKRGRPTENPCWSYFTRLDDQNVRCRICNKVVKSACATNMTKHLERHHQGDYQQLIMQIKQYRSQKCIMPGLSGDGSQNGNYIVHNQPAYTKAAEYSDAIYGAHFEREDSLFGQYERNADLNNWQANQWSNWPNVHDASTSVLEINTVNGPVRTGGVIIHGNGLHAQQWQTATPSTPEKPYMKRNRKTEHPVWEYFKRTADGNAQCSICTGVVKSPCSSNFMRHLMRHHSKEHSDVYTKWCQKRGPVTIGITVSK